MSKKKVIILSIVLLLSIAYVSRVAYVNIVQAPVKIVQYSIGDKIKHCNYQLQVTNYKILYKDEFIKKYGEFSDDSYDDDDYAFILVNMNYKMLSDKNYKNYKDSKNSKNKKSNDTSDNRNPRDSRDTKAPKKSRGSFKERQAAKNRRSR